MTNTETLFLPVVLVLITSYQESVRESGEGRGTRQSNHSLPLCLGRDRWRTTFLTGVHPSGLLARREICTMELRELFHDFFFAQFYFQEDEVICRSLNGYVHFYVIASFQRNSNVARVREWHKTSKKGSTITIGSVYLFPRR